MTTMPNSPEHDDNDMSPLLSEPFAQAWAAPAPGLPGRLGERLGTRLAQSLKAEQGMVTVRRRKAGAEPLAEGVQQRWLYRAPPERALRPGEPRAASVVELQAGTTLELPAGGPREFLVLRGSAAVDGESLGLRDFLLLPAGNPTRLASLDGAHVFVRESEAQGVERLLVLDRQAGWPDFAPGIRRRVLWTGGGQASLLYQTDPGASVPNHSHGHDEECLMVQGELFLDDVLLQQGDYQLAPAGTGHRITETDTGVILYAHGDLDLQFF
ncbi:MULTISPECIES: cupin domain-containing protein [unclassified Roseateles]|uniref:cupin domain-containing protein n=1 Tax=unclassified Roseateles TaxID=2626991 RepID=UPI000A862B7A|nr:MULTISPECIES: cupin domain-containing protein [unclassified Roseateles]